MYALEGFVGAAIRGRIFDFRQRISLAALTTAPP
jgi:hypothetical protein